MAWGPPAPTSLLVAAARRAGRALGAGARLVGQCAILWLVYVAADRLVRVARLPVPANLVGVLLLLLLLATGIVRPAHLAGVAGLVGRHLAFFFIPLVVGLMAWGDLLAASGAVLAGSILGGALASLAAAGLAAQRLGRRGIPSAKE